MELKHTKLRRVGPSLSQVRRARVQTSTARGPAKPIRILVPVDFSKPSKQAVRLAASFVQCYGGRITLLSVIEPDPFARLAAHPLALSTEALRVRLVSDLLTLGRRHVARQCFETALVGSGKAFEEIVKVARTRRTNLIVIGTHGHTGLKRLLLGSTAERVIRYAPCPVLTVPAEPRPSWPMRLHSS